MKGRVNEDKRKETQHQHLQLDSNVRGQFPTMIDAIVRCSPPSRRKETILLQTSLRFNSIFFLLFVDFRDE
jgi:hypothetical protein